MAASDEKLDRDTKRAATRSFPGYLADRALGRADFTKAASTSAAVAPAAPDPHKGDREKNPDAYKKGGSVKGRAQKLPDENFPTIGATVPASGGYSAGGMVRRGYGKARGA